MVRTVCALCVVSRAAAAVSVVRACIACIVVERTRVPGIVHSQLQVAMKHAVVRAVMRIVCAVHAECVERRRFTVESCRRLVLPCRWLRSCYLVRPCRLVQPCCLMRLCRERGFDVVAA